MIWVAKDVKAHPVPWAGTPSTRPGAQAPSSLDLSPSRRDHPVLSNPSVALLPLLTLLAPPPWDSQLGKAASDSVINQSPLVYWTLQFPALCTALVSFSLIFGLFPSCRQAHRGQGGSPRCPPCQAWPSTGDAPAAPASRLKQTSIAPHRL